MQTTKESSRARLVEALRSLRVTLARGREERLPAGIRLFVPLNDPGDGPDRELFQRFDEARRAAAAVCLMLFSGDETHSFLDTNIAPYLTLQTIRRFVLDVEQLDHLPAPVAIRRRLDELIEDLGGKSADDFQEGPWSKPDSPSRWAKVFKISSRTFIRYVAKETIHAKKLSDKSYQVLLSDIPK